MFGSPDWQPLRAALLPHEPAELLYAERTSHVGARITMFDRGMADLEPEPLPAAQPTPLTAVQREQVRAFIAELRETERGILQQAEWWEDSDSRFSAIDFRRAARHFAQAALALEQMLSA